MQAEERPGFWTRLGRGLWRVIRLLLLVAVLSALTIAVIFGVQLVRDEINRSVDNINARIDAQTQRLDGMQEDIAGLLTADQTATERLRGLETDVGSRLNEVERELTGVESRLSVDLERQSDALATLDARMDALAGQINDQADEAAAIDEALGALQGDINAANGRIDQVGGELDLLAGDIEGFGPTLDARIEALRVEYATPEEEVGRVLTALQYFRVWEMVARARLRLAESNPGLAASDVASALAIVQAISAGDGETAAALATVGERLDLAAAGLPADPAAASRDLEAAWEALDELLSELLLPLLPAAEVAPEAATAESQQPTEAAPEEVATPAPEPTLQPTPEPQPTPVPTPTP